MDLAARLGRNDYLPCPIQLDCVFKLVLQSDLLLLRLLAVIVLARHDAIPKVNLTA